MSDTAIKRLEHFVLICDRKHTKKFINLMAENGARGIETVYGKGSANAGAFAKALGLETEEKKAVLTCLISAENAERLIRILKDEHDFHRSNTGFAFCTPVEGLIF